ncbi:hypothetical protein [Staphylococcus aureus]|uniref:hypothetical protein n=1 Tax=Staphylococcus aureus TaxID=1280 RepID=UPI00044EC3CC|nr:hypothetical protein [Staphylococcus aureus]EZV56595.1 hypothetical protein V074_02736 [Staphylococcus aureus 2010-60-1240-1]HDE3760605.1 hypothetical protein [Staphylococcus aureus]HDE6300820.1 hypothetical protein [Staphylococcus aureus]HDE7633341.1 hypothetical protein [Staphylococcus aureus]HDE8127336.1 hypothetical protein [Staphylococcus aureus]
MLYELNSKLEDAGYDTVLDEEGIYINKYNIDIIQDDTNYLIAPETSDAIIVSSINEAITQVNNFVTVHGLEDELDKNNYTYKKSDLLQISIGDNIVSIDDGHFYLEAFDGSLEVYLNVSQIIGALQSRFLGEK